MKTKFRFEKLEVWQEARKLNRAIYRLTKKFPRREMFAMSSQSQRASVSITASIAEGSGRNSDKDFAHFVEQSHGSLLEVASLLYLALDEEYVTEAEIEPRLDGLEKLAIRIAALNRSLGVTRSKNPFSTSARPPALDPRLSSLD